MSPGGASVLDDTGAGAQGRPAEALRSAVYTGTVVHARTAGPRRRFSYRVALPLLFLDELGAASGAHPLAAFTPDGARRLLPAALRLRREDFLAPTDVPLDEAVRRAVADHGGWAAGPVAVLGHVRTWGWLFNPITVYYCFDAAGDRVEWTVLEVSNTPWHERHVYVVGPPGEHRMAKAMHVSPFLGMDAQYRVRYSEPGDRLDLHVDVHGDVRGEPRLLAGMSLRRRPLDRAGVRALLWRHPAMTLRVSSGIYAQALRLTARGAPRFGHPGNPCPAGGPPAHGGSGGATAGADD